LRGAAATKQSSSQHALFKSIVYDLPLCFPEGGTTEGSWFENLVFL